ncbi:phospholipid carrier-dependent glycosyltransferase [Amnibacterium sp. CER49]|uniref:dolichyl-phosphate-mannose--protein mannosyltransferase n=1 Tax=Amnibacterium sp. CER49 TaxID=3039161 RepID=UPI00244A5CBB|nr:phospholipid carrier-dependent glycosyltransferase [Amnibacterium sp. CER49]MDH2445520.1 phospholipid carrier-dependent glycosyltransferase [Amnibacterium sp. CER49]
MSRAEATAVPVREATVATAAPVLERLRAALSGRLLTVWGPVVVMVIAALTRLWAIGAPNVLVFDETFYVKDAWSLWHLGYEGSWQGTSIDRLFASGHVNGFLTGPSYVAHPPLGKWIIGLGEVLTGGANPAGWRVSVAVVGILAVALLMLVTHRMFRTPLVTVLAGFLLAIDNQAIVMSRVALLDNMVMFFALAGFACILEDRFWTERRFAAWLVHREHGVGAWGPTLLWRPWLLGAGVAFGLDSAVKWSGLYFLVAFTAYSIATDMMLRRRAGVRFWYSASLLKQAPATLLALVPAALVTYVISFTGYLLSPTHYFSSDAPWKGAFAWVPKPFQDLLHWHHDIYGFHTGLATPHPYSAPAILWPLIARPTSMYWDGASSAGGDGCRFRVCASAITDLPNPLIWYAGIAATIYLLVRFARRHEWQAGLILMGYVGGYLPWLLYPKRTMFFFYSIAFEPYLVLCLAATLGLLVLRPAATDDPDEIVAAEARYGMRVRRGIVIAFLGIAVLLSAFFFPLDSAMQTPYWFWQAHMWSTTWI